MEVRERPARLFSKDVCIEHSLSLLDQFFEALDPVFVLIKESEEGRDVMTLLKGPVSHSGFKRLN